ILLAGVLVPPIMLAVPQFLLFAEVGLTNTYLSVLLPSVVSPFGIYLGRVYAAAAVPDSLLEAARTEGAGDLRVFGSVALPLMLPGLVTVFLFQFVPSGTTSCCPTSSSATTASSPSPWGCTPFSIRVLHSRCS